MKTVGDMEFKAASQPVAPPDVPIGLRGRTAMERRIISLWNDYGKGIAVQAEAACLPVESALAVFAVESGRAYGSDGLVIIRFEPHVFRRKTGLRVKVWRNGQKSEWRNLTRAYEIQPEASLESTSWGLPQIMGFNWRTTRHGNAREMALAFQDSCLEQVAGFFGFIKANRLLDEIRNKDWRSFARTYNGPGQVDHYSRALIRAMSGINNLKRQGAAFNNQ